MTFKHQYVLMLDLKLKKMHNFQSLEVVDRSRRHKIKWLKIEIN